MDRGDRYYNHDSLWQNRADSNYPYWGPQSKHVYRQLISLLKVLRQDGAVLDVGCGTGAFGAELQKVGYTYKGVDDSGVAIALGKRLFPHLELAVADFAQLTDLAGAYDLITAVNVLHCLTSPSHRLRFWSNLKSLAGPKAKVVLTTMSAPVLPDYKPSKAPRAYLMPENIITEAREVGFKEVYLLRHTTPHGRNKVGNVTLVVG